MTDCSHLRFKANVDVHRIVKEEDAEEVGYENAPVQTFVFEATIECAQCGQPLSFLWDNLPDRSVTIPVTHDAMRAGPWTDLLRSSINAAIVPMPLEQVHVTNEAGTEH